MRVLAAVALLLAIGFVPLLLLLVLGLCVAAPNVQCAHRSCVDGVQFIFCQHGINISAAVAAPTDQLQIYYMQAPAFEGLFGNLFKGIGGYHTALGIVNLNTNKSYTLEYDAVSEVLK